MANTDIGQGVDVVFSNVWNTVKGRMILILIMSSVVPLSLLGGVSYSSLYSFRQTTLTQGIQEDIEKEMINLDNLLKNLNFVSQQIALDEAFARNIHLYLQTDDPFVRHDILTEASDRFSLMTFISPYAGTIALLDAESGEPFLSSFPVYDRIDPDSFPVLTDARGITYHAPHPTREKYDSKSSMVFSISRLVTDFEMNSSYHVYIESNFTAFPKLFSSQRYGEPVFHVLLDREGRIVYSADPQLLRPGTFYNGPPGRKWMSFKADSEQGWQLAIVMSKHAVQQQVNAWLLKFAIVVFLSLLASLLLAYLCWRTVYLPLHVLHKEIERMAEAEDVKRTKWLKLQEFDDVLTRFFRMKDQILQLIGEVEERARAQGRLEVEKLRHQINPHFIHNTLNTVQVIAKINRQDEIVKLVTHFTRILHYNLGKEGTHVRLEEEVGNLRDYLALQEIRYNHRFDVILDIDPSVQDAAVPRFLLQPLVENALYHGFRSRDGAICVTARLQAGAVVIAVEDNGEGMEPEKLQALAADEGKPAKTGMGIGLRFVDRLLRAYYGDAYGLRITSAPAEGTTVSITIPLREEGDRAE